MTNTTISKWNVTLYLDHTAHLFTVFARDKDSAFKEALTQYNSGQPQPISVWQVEEHSEVRLAS